MVFRGLLFFRPPENSIPERRNGKKYPFALTGIALKLKQVTSSEWQKLFCDALSSGPGCDKSFTNVRLCSGCGVSGFRF